MGYPTTYPEDCDPAYSHNHTNNAWYAYTWFYTRDEIRTFTYGLPLVLIICLLGNGSFLFVVARCKRLHTNTNVYLACLAMTDVSYVLTSVGPYLQAFYDSPVRHDIPYNAFIGCTLSFGSAYGLYFTSIGLVTLVSFERYYAICLPLKHRAISSRRRTRALILTTFLIGLILGFTRALKYSRLQRYCVIWPQLPDFAEWPQKVEFCVSVNDSVGLNLFTELLDTLPFFIALLWNGYMYARIVYTLSNRPLIGKNGDASSSSGQTRLQIQAFQIRNQVARVLIINGCLFFLCQIWVRFNYINNILTTTLGVKLYPSEAVYGVMLVFGRCMLYVNSSLNPFVYILTSSYYRDAYKEVLYGRMFDCATCRREELIKSTERSRVVSVVDVSSQNHTDSRL